MSTGLIALLDDIALLAKMAAASLDDAASQAVKASGKAAGIVIDDTAVTPRYVVGLAPDRELPIIGKIALGSLKNKLLFLLPGALGLSAVAPWAITPLLMAGGAFLCFEGFHKVMDLVHPHAPPGAGDEEPPPLQTAEEIENERTTSAIRTDFILSAEIMAIALSTVNGSPLWLEAAVLTVVAVVMTIGVYGVVALIVKADDAGVALAKTGHGAARALGRGIVHSMPPLLNALSFIGMLAMLWVGGGIITHGLHQLGAHRPEELIHQAGEAAGHLVPPVAGAVAWATGATISGLLGLVIGAVCDFAWRLANRARH